jgi:hypothetical protein
MKTKFLAFFLPQFHESDENNKWWGKGFTEWNLVKNATPLFKNHYQPRIPLDGYFDLSQKETISRQFKEAQSHGIDGFAIYHYWYLGKRLLNTPIDLIMADKDLDISFSICWANHSWTRSWKNRQGSLDLLIEQEYENNEADQKKHFEYLASLFLDNRYIRIGLSPLFQIYAPESIPNLQSFINNLRTYLIEKYSMEIHISGMITSFNYDWSYLDLFDSITFFQPSLALFSQTSLFKGVRKSFFDTNLIKALIRGLPDGVKKILFPIQDVLYNKAIYYDYDMVWNNLIEQYKKSSDSKYKIFPSAFVEFDNTPRYAKRARVTTGFTPNKFEKYLLELAHINKSEILFINAWNEWGEGMYLQGDSKHNNERLEIVKRVKQNLA